MDARTQRPSARDLASAAAESLRRLADDLHAASQGGDERRAASLQGLARRLERVVEDLQACAGRQTLVGETLRPEGFLREFAATVEPLLDVRLALRVRIDDDCPPCRADAEALKAALLRLVGVARDALPAGGTIELSARRGRLDDGSEATELGVLASGEPAPSDGLGLAAVDGFALQSGGCLRLRDDAGCTSASLLLPCANPAGPGPRG